MRSLWLVLLLLSSVFSVKVMADEQAVPSLLAGQLQLLGLLPEQSRLLRMMTQLQQTETDPALWQQAQQEIHAFWQQRGVTLAVNPALSAPSELQQVMALQPTTPDYVPVLARVRYLLWLESQPWPSLQFGSPLRPGDAHPLLAQLAQRLLWLGDLPQSPSDVTQYSAELVAAVRHFQRRHGLNPDGAIGNKTLYWLNLAPRQRARMLATGWVEQVVQHQQLPQRYLLVNIPAFSLSLVDAGQTVLTSRVVVGLPSRPTPLLQSSISSVVLNPAWHVPRSIIRKDILRHLQQDGHYLESKQFRVVDDANMPVLKSAEEWQQLAQQGRFPYRLVQQPGPHNALGRYKFHFSNSFDVYLHDTPEKPLFERAERALSSGCVRVEKADELAQWLATHLVVDTKLWQNMQDERSRTQWFTLQQPLPVYLVYWTAWLDEQQLPQFRQDIYHQQQ